MLMSPSIARPIACGSLPVALDDIVRADRPSAPYTVQANYCDLHIIAENLIDAELRIARVKSETGVRTSEISRCLKVETYPGISFFSSKYKPKYAWVDVHHELPTLATKNA